MMYFYDRMSQMYKVRFHLASGSHYKMWQIKDGKEITFHNPQEVNLSLWHCRLRNRRAIAEKIYYGDSKSVCAWIECEKIEVSQAKSIIGIKISYNPRVKPYWVMEDENVDDQLYDLLVTYSACVFSPKVLKFDPTLAE